MLRPIEVMSGNLLTASGRALARVGLAAASSRYEVRLAAGQEERLAAFRLRYEVFNLELGEGLPGAEATGLDQDDFDDVMEHLLVIERKSGRLVGTYRLQCGARASCGFYSAQIFDFAPYRPFAAQFLELGRACLHRDHRTATVILLLWQAIADYAREAGCRYLIGCSSLTSQSPAAGWAAWREMEQTGHLAPEQWRTLPQPGYALPEEPPETVQPIPRLLRAYLGVGAKVCAPPAIDRVFGTIDFLTILDLAVANPIASGRFLKTLEK
jgi:putative hemolysin